PYVDSSAAFAEDSYVEISPFGSLSGFNPLPGLNIFAKSMPSPIATVVIILNYKIVLKPYRLTVLDSPKLELDYARDQTTTRIRIIFIKFKKISPRGLI